MTIEEKLKKALELLEETLPYVEHAYYNDGEYEAKPLMKEVREFVKENNS